MTVSPARAERRVIIVEDHRLFAEAVDLALTVEGYDVRRIDAPPDPDSPGALVTAIIKQQPVVVLLDLDLGRFGDAVRLIEPIAELRRRRHRGHRFARPRPVGRRGPRRRPQGRVEDPAARDIIATVRRVVAGLPVMDRAEREELLSEWSRKR